MDVDSGRVVIARDVKCDKSTLYNQILRTLPRKFSLKLAEQANDYHIDNVLHKLPNMTV